MERINPRFGRGRQISLDDLTDGFWEWDLKTNENYVSPTWGKNFGYEDHDIRNHQDWLNIVHPDDKQYIKNIQKMYFEKQIPKYEVKYRIISKQGQIKWVLSKGKAIWDGDKPIYMMGTHMDITDHVVIEQALGESEERYKKVVETSPDAVFCHDKSVITYVNQAGIMLLGAKDKNDIIGRTIYEFVHPRYKEAARTRIEKMLIKKSAAPMMEQKMLTLDGRIVDGEVVSSTYRFKEKDYVLTFVRDVTHSKKIYRDLKESEHRYSKLIELSPDAIVISNRKQILFINNAGVKLLGYNNKDEILNMEYATYFYPQCEEVIKNRFNYMKNDVKFSKRMEVPLRQKNGNIIEVEVASAPLTYKGKRAILDVVRDVSERKKAELQLKNMMEENKRLLDETIEYDKLKTEFFSTISHELKTPLNIILSAMQLLDLNHCTKEKCVFKDKMIKYISMSKQNCYRLLRLINNLIDITRLDTGFMKMNLKNYNIVSVIEDITLSVVEYANEKGIDIIFDTDTEDKIMACDADKIERVVLNLLSNSIKFTEPGGRIIVSITDQADSIIISIRDTGIGIPKDKLNIIFERFRQVDSTLTRRREGSGIGLSLVKALVEAHDGHIYAISEEGKGSEFTIQLPVTLVDNMDEDEEDYTKVANVERISIEFSDIYSS